MQIGLIGAGNMARALARGWGEPVLCSDAASGRAHDALERGGVRPALQDAFDAVVGAGR